jgi:hypothetical protein
MTLEEIRDEIEDASAPSVSLNKAIAEALGVGIRNYTSSMDDAIGLLKETLPGWHWQVESYGIGADAFIRPDYSDPAHLRDFLPENERFSWDGVEHLSTTEPAMALCQAIIEAHIEIKDTRR